MTAFLEVPSTDRPATSRPAGRPSPVTGQPDRAALFRIASALLDYPDAALLARRDELVAALTALPRSPARTALARLADWLCDTDPIEAARHYVATFDLRRRCSLYLTYYLHGDTRRRGMALLVLKQRYRAAGLDPDEAELPDYLPLVLEFAGYAGPQTGEAPLRQHRAGLELIRIGLRDAGSPYAYALDAVCQLLPDMSLTERTKIATLALEGPPDEAVGLGPFAPPEYLTGFVPPLIMGAVFGTQGSYAIGLMLLSDMALAAAVYTAIRIPARLSGTRRPSAVPVQRSTVARS